VTAIGRPTATSLRLGRPRDWLVGAALLGGVLLGVAFTVGWAKLLAPWGDLSAGELLPLLLLSALSYGLRAVRVYDYFRPRFRGRFPTVLRLSVLHNSANNLLPMRAGEMVFPWLMGRYFSHGFLDATAALVWIRLLDLHSLGLIGILTLWLRSPSWIWPVAAIAWLALLPLAYKGGSAMPAGEGGGVRRLLRRALQAAPASFGRVLRVYLWTTLIWASKFAAFAALLHHFLPVSLWLVLTGVMGAELSSVLPFHGIAGSGSYELAMVAALVPLGVSPQAALAGAVNLHLFLLGVTLLLGGLAFLLPVQRPPTELAKTMNGD
jgi:uncharacterized membrane protein YbhN (UPF0104 family)